ncbi:hypothetical protein SAMN05444274_103155 [Mariniphaga anaerophila]|uniref:Phosphoribosyl-AMP cyclohydrolase n=1 Tax=Mariniphaga anaerophila TaxID=1484053 RepID=A0A1M4XX00_9BACT|nr:hypothetical protein [Mariniphaga anaerophila]SHE97989.1 hypothetical protein SAMN05444274_103155 [Mariniphaga anaerophila]
MKIKKKHLTKKKIREAQKSWGEGVVAIGKAFVDNQNYKLLAEEFIKKHYGYAEGVVLFKPTLASIEQFRDTFEKALSYFVAGNSDYQEDQGFAIRPWVKVRFQNVGIITKGNHAVAMGNYFFTDKNGDEIKVEYTFGYFENENNEIKINLHHSSIPYLK